MAELGLFKAILGLKKAELELFGGNIQVLAVQVGIPMIGGNYALFQLFDFQCYSHAFVELFLVHLIFFE